MTRAELEALIWRHSHLLAGAPAQAREAVDTILSAADAYAATTLGEIDSYRRARTAARHARQQAST